MRDEKSSARGRLFALDALRGLIMALMALDHAAFFIAGVHPTEMWSRPLPEYQAILPFLTRFATHLCAPGFLFLMGAGMVFFAESRRGAGWPQTRIVKHFIVRGSLLILLQVLIIDPAWMLPSLLSQSAQAGGGFIIYVGVLFALGGSMILGGFLVRLRPAFLVAAGCSAVLLTQLLVLHQDAGGQPGSIPARLLWLPGLSELFYVNYPVLPWIGLTLLGMALARVQGRDGPLRSRLTLLPGLLCLGLFLAVRGFGGFGNFHPPADGGLIAFLNVTKYPPSLSFVLLTLGGNLLLLFAFSRLEQVLGKGGRWLQDFGRTPLFFYVLHLYLYGFISLLYPEETGLPGMYPLWLLGLVLLLPACRRYARFKGARPQGSLWRLF